MLALFQSSAVPIWLTYVLLIGSLAGYVIGVISFFDRRKRELRTDLKSDAGLELLGWSLPERLALEKRLAVIESEVANQRELQEVLERMMAKVLHSPHRPELDRLLEKIDYGARLSDEEVNCVSDWLHAILNDPNLTKGEQTAASILLVLLNSKYKIQKVAH